MEATNTPAATTHLEAFAAEVNTIATATQGPGRYGDRKIYLATIWMTLQATPGHMVGWPEFTRLVIEANRQGLITLARGDYPAGMDAELVEASHIRDLNSDFHFVLDPTV